MKRECLESGYHAVMVPVSIFDRLIYTVEVLAEVKVELGKPPYRITIRE